MMTDDEIIAVVQAYKDGKQIQARPPSGTKWHDIRNHRWDFLIIDYRVKPEPRKPREWYMCPTTIRPDVWKMIEITESTENHACIRVREVIEDATSPEVTND